MEYGSQYYELSRGCYTILPEVKTYCDAGGCLVRKKNHSLTQFGDPPGTDLSVIAHIVSYLEWSSVTKSFIFGANLRTDTLCETNDHLLGRGLVGHFFLWRNLVGQRVFLCDAFSHCYSRNVYYDERNFLRKRSR